MDINERNKMFAIGDRVVLVEGGIGHNGIVDSVYENPAIKEIQYTVEIPHLQEFKVCLEHELKPYAYAHVSTSFQKRRTT